jgi:hypothetical protein
MPAKLHDEPEGGGQVDAQLSDFFARQIGGENGGVRRHLKRPLVVSARKVLRISTRSA